MIKDINYYCQKFSNAGKNGLNVSRKGGIALNKPVLLLSIIELIERGKITKNRIYLTPELIATFLKLWTDLDIHRHPDIGLPFFHLKGDSFWHFKGNSGFEFVESPQSKVKVRTIKALNEAVDYAYLDPELFALLSQLTFRNQLTLVLIDSWFSDKTPQIRRSLSVDALEDLENRLLASGGKVYQRQEIEKEDEQTIIVRDGAFRKAVTSVYGYRCAFCELQVFNNLENIVDGAHIKPFSQFYDDRINNGLSLCKNHHWAFDRFWFTINDDYTIELSESLHEDSPHSTPMSQFQGKRLSLPNNERYHPSSESLAWHRQSFLDKQTA
ncbi:HNH endonuclease [Crocosphaera sp. XPORK-15E]|uniref:HNH endonuclease n=1 Tax=Crocosphaera sp. XPORK-15E TaxID=3110247 RepID=UPI002B20BC45|nr:HNH endonuclease [Crocosphaera sp. XPORK-15E]MEA5536801.1 HNH endonuclease [Crocosphaera sp. XPORK-15E]